MEGFTPFGSMACCEGGNWLGWVLWLFVDKYNIPAGVKSRSRTLAEKRGIFSLKNHCPENMT
jgi:hypothetical protein